MKKLLLALALFFAFGGLALATVNINTATREELMTIKGIGEKRAQDIIDYRTKHGAFKSVDDLEKVPGIGPGTLKQIRSQVSVSGKTVIAAETKSKAPEPAKAKAEETKKSAGPKADEKKSERAKEKSKSDEKGKAEKKGEEKAAKKAADAKEPKKEKSEEKKAVAK